MADEVKLEILPWLSRALGKSNKVTFTEKIRKDDDLKSLLERVAEKYASLGAMIYNPKHGTLDDAVVVFVNNRPIPKDLKLKIKGGDTIVITPFYSGG